MPLPPAASFVPIAQVQARGKIKLPCGLFLKPLLIGTEGMTDTGKTRFAMTIPGIIQGLMVDRNFTAVLDSSGMAGTNPNIFMRTFTPPPQGTVVLPQNYRPGQETDYSRYYKEIRTAYYEALEDSKSTVVWMDGDSDYWEIHILAHFGKTTQIFPQTRYAAPYAEKRAQITRARDSGKIVICSNKVKDEYETVYGPDGLAKKDDQGNDVRQKTGNKERQGFKDQDFLWDIQLRHMYKAAHVRQLGNRTVEVPQQWGIHILKCKCNMEMVGQELWGDDCNFRGLVELVYPDVDVRRWGFEK